MSTSPEKLVPDYEPARPRVSTQPVPPVAPFDEQSFALYALDGSLVLKVRHTQPSAASGCVEAAVAAGDIYQRASLLRGNLVVAVSAWDAEAFAAGPPFRVFRLDGLHRGVDSGLTYLRLRRVVN